MSKQSLVAATFEPGPIVFDIVVSRYPCEPASPVTQGTRADLRGRLFRYSPMWVAGALPTGVQVRV